MEQQNTNRQYLASLVVSLLGVGFGTINGWSSPMNILLISEETPLPSGKLTKDEISWATSTVAIGGLIGSLSFGLIANRFGRKSSLILLSFGMIAGWLLIWFAQNAYYLYVARVIHGATINGVFTVTQFYFVEVADDSVRGTLGSITPVAGNVGVVIAFVLGTYSTYYSIPIFMIPLLVLFAIVFFIFFPETPLYLVKQDKIAEAKQSIQFYKNIHGEHETCKSIIDAEVARLKSSIEGSQSAQSSFKWSDLITNPGRKAMIIGVVLAALYHLSGSFALISYTATIFQESGSFVSANESALAVGCIRLIGTIVVPLLVDRAGRKILYVISTIGSTLGFTVLGLYMLLKFQHYEVEPYNWIPIVSYSFVVLVQSLAINSLLFAVTAEIMPECIKEFGVSFTNAFLAVNLFLVLKFMPFVSERLGFHGTMFLFGGICIPCTLFIIFYVPETKGKSHEEIMDLLK